MADKLKVLQVLGSLGMGGAESRMMDIYRHVDRTACGFDFVSLSPGKEYYEDEIRSLGGNVFKVPSPRECGIFRHIRQLRGRMRDGGYDVVHAHTSYHCGIVMLAAWLEHVPVRISHARTTGSQRGGWKLRVGIVVGRALIGLFSTKRLAISEAAGKFAFGNSGFEVLPNAIVTKNYQTTPPETAEALRKELGIPPGARVIGHIGRFDPMKNHRFIMEWFARYLEEQPDAYLVLVGDGKLRAETERLAEARGIGGHARFAGIRGDVPQLIHAFDAMIFPSTFEGLGVVALEAQAAGVPMVASDAIPKEADMECGLLRFCALDAPFEAWSGAIDECVGTSKSYEEINAAFRRHNMSLEHEVSRLMEIYRER